MSNSRLEKFIYAICGMEVDDLPTPLSRIETLWNCLIIGETPDFEPLSRNEKYLMSMLTGDVDALPEPTSRSEKLLYKIATGETDLSDVPGYLSRYEELLKYLIENGGIGGTDFEYVLYTLNDSFSTLYSTAEAPVKSAILKGQTLVNILGNYPEQTFTLDNTWQQRNIPIEYTNLIKPNTTYTFVFNVTECQMADSTKSNLQIGDDRVFNNVVNLNLKLGVNTYKLTTKDSITFPLKLYGSAYNSGTLTFNLMLLEGDYVGQNIPYFEGMQSVKMPVLTTCGENLFDGETERGFIDFNTGNNSNAWNDLRSVGYTEVIGGNKINIYVTNSGWTSPRIFEYDKAKNFIKSTGEYSVVLDNATKFVRFNIGGNTDVDGKSQVMLYYGEANSSTTYEPYKSNILSCNEEVTLRGIGDVKDTLDGNTGELTQRIGEVVLDGSEDWVIENPLSNDEYVYFKLNDPNTIKSNVPTTMVVNVLTDKLKISSYAKETSTKSNSYFQAWTSHFIGISRTELSTQDVVGFKEWLSNNNIPIQYPLSEKSIKTVGLSITDQDGQPTKLKTFNDITHVSIEAEDLLPIIDLEVATKIEETLSSLPTQMIDISETQQSLNEKIDEQAENINEVSTAMTEIHNDIL